MDYVREYGQGIDGQPNMRHCIFNFRILYEPLDLKDLEATLAGLRTRAPKLIAADIMPMIYPCVLSVILTTYEESDWLEKTYEDAAQPAVYIDLITLVSSAMRNVRRAT